MPYNPTIIITWKESWDIPSIEALPKIQKINIKQNDMIIVYLCVQYKNLWRNILITCYYITRHILIDLQNH